MCNTCEKTGCSCDIDKNIGWTCPQCGRVYSPKITICQDCVKINDESEITKQKLLLENE